ncbi:MAG: hypothetical protein FWH03_08545 [Firmicutes bacterium]|nr:hypothetical protein [Bacillota bacterium]
MSGKEQIIQSILSDAQENAEKLLIAARQKADELTARAETQAAQLLADARQQNKNLLAQAVQRAEQAARLERGKSLLAAKRHLLLRCFSSALEKLSALPQKEYLALIASLLRHAQNGDTVVIAKKDANQITQAFLDKHAAHKLHLSKEFGDFTAGIRLINPNYEQNLSFEFLLEYLREELEPTLAGILF